MNIVDKKIAYTSGDQGPKAMVSLGRSQKMESLAAKGISLDVPGRHYLRKLRRPIKER